MQYLIAYDFGTTGVKTCLFGADFVTHSNDQDGVAHALRQLLG